MQVEAVGNSPSWQSDLSTAFTGVLAPTQPDELYMDLSSACKPWSGSHNINTTRNETLPRIFPELIGKFPDGESD